MPVYVDHIPRNLGLDVLRAVGVLESVVGFVVMNAGRTDTDNHDSLAVTAERELEQTCKFRVTVWDMVPFCGIAKSVDTVTES